MKDKILGKVIDFIMIVALIIGTLTITTLFGFVVRHWRNSRNDADFILHSTSSIVVEKEMATKTILVKQGVEVKVRPMIVLRNDKGEERAIAVYRGYFDNVEVGDTIDLDLVDYLF